MRRPSVNKDCVYSCRSSKKGRREKNIPFLREMKNFSSRPIFRQIGSSSLDLLEKSYFPPAKLVETKRACAHIKKKINSRKLDDCFARCKKFSFVAMTTNEVAEKFSTERIS